MQISKLQNQTNKQNKNKNKKTFKIALRRKFIDSNKFFKEQLEILDEHLPFIIQVSNNLKNFLLQKNDKKLARNNAVNTRSFALTQNIQSVETIVKYKGIYLHKNKNANSWYARIKRNYKTIYVSGKTQKECFQNYKRTIKEQEAFPLQNSITLFKWYKKWLELYKIGKVKDVTIRDYEKILRHFPTKLLNKVMNKITLEELVAVINSVKAERMKQKVYELLMALFLKAKNHDYVDRNLMERIEKPKHIKINSQALTKKQEEEFIKTCRTIKCGDYFLLTLFQGLRHGEALGITYEDVDLEHQKLRINKSFNYDNKFDTTKNYQSNRVMPIFKRTYRILKKYHGNKNERIFNKNQSELVTIKTKLQNKLSFKFKIKDLRTTFITRCQEKGIPEFVIQSWVGHKIGSKVTRSVYTKFNEEDNLKYVDIVNDE